MMASGACDPAFAGGSGHATRMSIHDDVQDLGMEEPFRPIWLIRSQWPGAGNRLRRKHGAVHKAHAGA